VQQGISGRTYKVYRPVLELSFPADVLVFWFFFPPPLSEELYIFTSVQVLSLGIVHLVVFFFILTPCCDVGSYLCFGGTNM
jgi:hypothetical protein